MSPAHRTALKGTAVLGAAALLIRVTLDRAKHRRDATQARRERDQYAASHRTAEAAFEIGQEAGRRERTSRHLRAVNE